MTLLAAGIITVTGCHMVRKNDAAATSDGAITEANSAYSASVAEAQAAGAGTESAYGEQGVEATQQLSKRTYYFDFDSNVVREDDKPAIVAHADYLLSHANAKIMLEGHTDPRGSREYNVGLGERRAKAIAEILTAKGVNPAQIRIVSYGAEKLAANGHSDSDYQLDRRSILVYLQR